jgi:hypothetical protein
MRYAMTVAKEKDLILPYAPSLVRHEAGGDLNDNRPGLLKPELVIKVSPVADIKDLDNLIIMINGVYDPKSLGFYGLKFGKFLLQIITGKGLVTKLV